MNKKTLIIIIALLLLLVIFIGIAVWALFFREIAPVDEDDTEGILRPDYPPQNTEQNQKPIPNDPGGEIQTPDGGGGVNITYSKNVTVDLSEKKATLYYANPSRSNQNAKIGVMIGERVVLESELITPGNMVTSLPLSDGAESFFDAESIGEYDAELVVGFYDPQTGAKAMVDSRGAVKVIVKE